MKNWVITSIFLLCMTTGFAQAFPEGIAYQAQVHSSDGGFLSNATVGVEFNIRSSEMTGTIVWQETHTVELNSLGHFSVVIGEGVSTGVGTSTLFEEINWAGTTFFLEMLIDEENIGTYVSSMTQQMMAVPFAFVSKTTAQKFKISELEDVDTTGIEVGDALVWDGEYWVVQELPSLDSVNFSYFSDSANYAAVAGYALNCDEIPEIVDSALYAYYGDTANYALMGLNAIRADEGGFSDSANVALFALNNWGISGNDNVNSTVNFLGTIDSVDLVVKSFNTERMRVKANGRIGIGTDNPLTDLHIDNTDGVLYTGTFGEGTIPVEGAGARMMWYPGKAAFRAGVVTTTFWNDALIGDYSFASGYNTRATADYSVAFGFSSYASGEGAFAVGHGALASGEYTFAAGHSPEATGDNSIALGRGALARGESSISIGYHPTSDAPYALSLGNFTYAHGESSVAIGYHAEALHDGAFVYRDYSAGTDLESTAENQFMVKATGGTIFYTSADLSTGVELLPGAGSWSILSDRNKKENIASIDAQEYLKRLDNIEVYSWSYKSQDSSITHIGPMAQDFHATFGLGKDATSINSGDFDGVNLLLIKALDEKVSLLEQQSLTVKNLKNELAELKEQREKLYQLLMKLELEIGNGNQVKLQDASISENQTN